MHQKINDPAQGYDQFERNFPPQVEQAFLGVSCFTGLIGKYSDEEVCKRFPTLRSLASSPGIPAEVTTPVPIDGEKSAFNPDGSIDMPDDDVSWLWLFKCEVM